MCVFNVVPDNKEVARVIRFTNSIQLVIESLANGFGEFTAIFFAQALITEFFEVRVIRVSFGHLVFRHQIFAVIQLKFTPIGYFKRVGDGFWWIILQRLPHLVNVLKVEMVIKPKPILIVDGFLRLDAEKDIVHVVVGFVEVVAIVCTDERKIELFRQLHHYRIRLKFLVDVVILHFNIKIPFPHYLHERFEVLNALLPPIGTEKLRHLPLDASC